MYAALRSLRRPGKLGESDRCHEEPSALVDHFAFARGWPFDRSGNSIAQTSLSDFSDQV
jgi:hypothetical protein